MDDGYSCEHESVRLGKTVLCSYLLLLQTEMVFQLFVPSSSECNGSDQ